MRKALGSTIFVVVVAVIVAGVAYALNFYARTPSPTKTANLSSGVYVVHEDVFPFNTCTSDSTNANADAPFVALYPKYQQCSSSGDNYNWVYYSDPIINVPTNTVIEMEIYNYDSATPILNNYYTQPQGMTSSTINVSFPAVDKSGQNLVTAPTDAVVSSGIGNQGVKVVPASCSKGQSSCFATYQPTVQYGPGAATAAGDPTLANVDPFAVSHTFVIHGIASGSQPYLYVSAPIMGAQPANPTDQNPTPPPADAAGMSAAPIITTFTFRTPSTPGHYVWQCFDPCGANYNGFGGPMSTFGYMSGQVNVG